MIVNIETRDKFNPATGDNGLQLIISYINKEGNIDYLHGFISKADMYNWYYPKESTYGCDKHHMSWDNKPVRKGSAEHLTDSRIRELICDILKQRPELSVINELNIPDTAFCDIEVNVTDDGFPDAIRAANPVNTVSWVHGTDVTVLGRANLSAAQIKSIQKRIDEHCAIFDEKYNFTYRYFESEVDMLTVLFRDYMGKVSCVTGWNWFGYDYPYLYNRAYERLGIDMIGLMMGDNLNGTTVYNPQNAKTREERIHIPYHRMMYDYMEIYAKWDRSISPKESNKLDWVSEKALGVKKVVHELGFKALWEQKPDEYVFYNGVDSILVREIDKKLKTAQTFFTLANLLHVPALVAFSPVRSLEVVQTEYLYREGKVFPKVAKEPTLSSDSYTGAFVYEPIPGVYRNVIALDFASLYPSTIRQFNISPDTFLGMDYSGIREEDKIKTISGAVYERNRDGFVPNILTDFYKQRKMFKKEMQIAEKEKGELEEILERRLKEKRI